MQRRRADQVGEDDRDDLARAGGSAAGGAPPAAPVAAPHSSQNFAVGGSSAPQFAQGRGSGSRAFLAELRAGAVLVLTERGRSWPDSQDYMESRGWGQRGRLVQPTIVVVVDTPDRLEFPRAAVHLEPHDAFRHHGRSRNRKSPRLRALQRLCRRIMVFRPFLVQLPKLDVARSDRGRPLALTSVSGPRWSAHGTTRHSRNSCSSSDRPC